MKKKNHPEMFNIIAICSCGKKIKIESTHKDNLNIDICNFCHPFYTGGQRIIHNIGRIGRFNKQFNKFF